MAITPPPEASGQFSVRPDQADQNADDRLGSKTGQTGNNELDLQKELLAQQDHVRDLVYTRPGHFFSGHALDPINSSPPGARQYREFSERVITERESGTSIVNAIALNSSNEPPQQIDNLRKIQEILRRCNQRFDEYSFREGRHNLDDLAPDDASKRLFAQMYVASMITHTGNMGQLAHQFHEIDYFVKNKYIQPAEIIAYKTLLLRL